MNRALLIDTPLGPMTVTASEEAVIGVRFGSESSPEAVRCSEAEAPEVLRRAAGELCDYFTGKLRRFTVPLAPQGSAFQMRVWEALRTIGYGETRTYKEIAVQIGHSRSYRAVGMANNRNPIAILIPCHRVIGSDGSLTGYAGGIGIKEWLLDFERRH